MLRPLLLVALLLLAGCNAPSPTPPADGSTTPSPSPAPEPAPEPGFSELPPAPSPLYAGLVVPHKGAWYIPGGYLPETGGQAQPWRIQSNGTVTALPDVAVEGVGTAWTLITWSAGWSDGDEILLLGSWLTAGMCCAHYYGTSGAHSDGYYETHHTVLAHWDPATGAARATEPSCMDRGRFAAVRLGDDVYLLGGRASASTDVPARWDARIVLHLDADQGSCAETAMALPSRVEQPQAFVSDGAIVVLSDEGQTWSVDPTQGSLREVDLGLPEAWYGPVAVATGPDGAYLFGVVRFDNETGAPVLPAAVLRVADGNATVLPDQLDRIGWRSAALWTGTRFLIVGGAQAYEGGVWTASDRVTSYLPTA